MKHCAVECESKGVHRSSKFVVSATANARCFRDVEYHADNHSRRDKEASIMPRHRQRYCLISGLALYDSQPGVWNSSQVNEG
jgi:hypothetical protein